MSCNALDFDEKYLELDELIKRGKHSSVFLVCDRSIEKLYIYDYFAKMSKRLDVNVIQFDDFKPNPDYTSVEAGVKLFKESKSEIIIAVGGGSAIDVAKCIKLYAKMSDDGLYLKQEIVANDIKLVAVPTTAGTGSEATKFAVIYYNGEKQSVSHDSSIPSMVILDPKLLKTLPEFQKKATMLDALCHAIESFWSVNSNDESKKYSKEAMSLVLSSFENYLNGAEDAAQKMLMASNLAGKAINITQTTAGHAMSYKITSLYNIPHGFAAALCVEQVWEYMLNNKDKCCDIRGAEYLSDIFAKLAVIFNTQEQIEAMRRFSEILNEIDIPRPVMSSANDLEVLCDSVNQQRLKNNPVSLERESIEKMYRDILN